MPGSKSIVTNTSPLIALAAGLGSLDILTELYERVVVPHEVPRVIKLHETCYEYIRYIVETQISQRRRFSPRLRMD